MGALSPTHWMIIVGVLVLLFGAKRLPDAARSLGRSARILKAEVHEINPEPGPACEVPAAAVPPPAMPSLVRPLARPAAETSSHTSGI